MHFSVKDFINCFIYFFFLKQAGRNNKRQVDPHHCAVGIHGWPSYRQQLAFSLNPHGNGRDTTTCATTGCLQGVHSQEAAMGGKPGHLVGDKGL